MAGDTALDDANARFPNPPGRHAAVGFGGRDPLQEVNDAAPALGRLVVTWLAYGLTRSPVSPFPRSLPAQRSRVFPGQLRAPGPDAVPRPELPAQSIAAPRRGAAASRRALNAGARLPPQNQAMPIPIWSVLPIDPTDAPTARALMAVCREAYSQEAALLGVPPAEFPPLQRSLWAVQSSGEAWLGCFDGAVLAGVLSLYPDPDDEGVQCIGTLAVAPAQQRLGVASLLLHAVTVSQGRSPVSVQVAALNAPALAFLAQHGFRELQRWAAPIGAQSLRWLKLGRKPQAQVVSGL